MNLALYTPYTLLYTTHPAPYTPYPLNPKP